MSFAEERRLVYIEGRLQTRSWDDSGSKRSKTEVVAQEVKFLDRSRAGGQSSAAESEVVEVVEDGDPGEPA